MTQQERYMGMLWGLVVGDCLGSPIQFSDKDNHPFITEMEYCPVFKLPAGYWTDDSSMAFCVMESFSRLGKYDLADIAHNFVRWIDEGFWSSADHAFDIGNATWSAVDGIKNGRLKNGTEDSQGNGSIMRFAPSYIMARELNSPAILHEISDLTHDSHAVRKTVDKMAAVLDDHCAGRKTEIQSSYATREAVNNSGWCVSTLDAALWAFHTTKNFRDGMVAAVNLGGDSDSIGAVYGQIAGAYYGLSTIPAEWKEAVKDWKKVDDFIIDFLQNTKCM